MGLDKVVPMEQYGPTWKEGRRLYQAHLSKDACRTLYRADIEAHTRNYVLRSIEAGRNTTGDYDLYGHPLSIEVLHYGPDKTPNLSVGPFIRLSWTRCTE